MSGFTGECLRCGAGFTGPLPRVFCPPCRPLAAAEMAEAQVRVFEAADLMPGDLVRRRTGDDRMFERAVLADLAGL